MTDPRIKTLAKNLIGFSCAVKTGEKILIEGNGECTELVKALVKETYAAGGVPFVWIKKPEVCRELALGATKEQQELMAKIDCELMRHMDAYIGIGAKLNTNEMSDVPGDKRRIRQAAEQHSHTQHQVVRAALSQPQLCPDGRHEHRGLRGLLL